MADDDKRYIRVYHKVVDDPKFDGIWDDDARLALWVRLLMAADQAWPQSATVPRSAKASALKALVDCGLVDMVGRDHVRIHGMDAERTRRSELAQSASHARWNAPRNAERIPDGNAEVMPNRNRTEHNNGSLVVTGEPRTRPQPRPNTVDKVPLYREIRAAIAETYGEDKE